VCGAAASSQPAEHPRWEWRSFSTWSFSLVDSGGTLSFSKRGNFTVALQSLSSGLYISAPDTATALQAKQSKISKAEQFISQTMGLLGGYPGLWYISSLQTGHQINTIGNNLNALYAKYNCGDAICDGELGCDRNTDGVTAAGGNGAVVLKWNPAKGARTYNVMRATSLEDLYESRGHLREHLYRPGEWRRYILLPRGGSQSGPWPRWSLSSEVSAHALTSTMAGLPTQSGNGRGEVMNNNRPGDECAVASVPPLTHVRKKGILSVKMTN